MGGQSYIDNVLLRDRDDNTAWTTASDGTKEQRLYYCHNWRNDIVAMLTDDGKMQEWVKYDSYGRPYGIPVADTNGDGTVDATDATNINTDWWTDTDKVTGDTDLDGSIDADDATTVSSQSGTTLGWDALSDVGSRKGYGGYEFDDGLMGAKPVAHGRARVYVRDQWLQRDPLEYIDGPSLYLYAKSSPLIATDPSGLISSCGRFISGTSCEYYRCRIVEAGIQGGIGGLCLAHYYLVALSVCSAAPSGGEWDKYRLCLQQCDISKSPTTCWQVVSHTEVFCHGLCLIPLTGDIIDSLDPLLPRLIPDS